MRKRAPDSGLPGSQDEGQITQWFPETPASFCSESRTSGSAGLVPKPHRTEPGLAKLPVFTGPQRLCGEATQNTPAPWAPP